MYIKRNEEVYVFLNGEHNSNKEAIKGVSVAFSKKYNKEKYEVHSGSFTYGT